MKFKSIRAAVSGLVVLSLSLISCTENDTKETSPAAPSAKPWGIQEPVIAKTNGEKIMYSEANLLPQMTFSVDDQLLFADEDVNNHVQVRFLTLCLGREERIRHQGSFALVSSLPLKALVPKTLFFSPTGKPFSGLSCSFELTAVNATGRRKHIFKALTLQMNDESQNSIQLNRAGKTLSDTMEILAIDELNRLYLPSLTAGSRFELFCERGGGIAERGQISVAAMMRASPKENSSRPQLCRVLETAGDTVMGTSPFFRVHYFNEAGVLTEMDRAVVPTHKDYTSLNGKTRLRRQTLHNSMTESIWARAPKTVEADVVTYLWGLRHQKWPTKLHVEISGGAVTEDENYLWVEIQPRQRVTFDLVWRTNLLCSTQFRTIELYPRRESYLSAVDVEEPNFELARWPLNDDIQLEILGSPYLGRTAPMERLYPNRPSQEFPGSCKVTEF